MKIKDELLKTVKPDDYVDFSEINREEIETWKFRTLSLLKKILNASDNRISEFTDIYFPEEKKYNIYKIYWPEYYNLRAGWGGTHFDRVLGILKSIENEIDKGLLEGLEDQISGDIFESVLERANYLLKSGFKRAAAVYGRVVLEQTIRRLCDKQKPPIVYNSHSKASQLNDKLKKSNYLSTHEWRQIQAWFDIGNDAAHKKTENYTIKEVGNFLTSLTEFIEKKLGTNV